MTKRPVLRIRDVYSGSRIRIQNRNKREGWKKICCHIFFYSHKFHKKKKILASFQRIIELFTLKFAITSQKYGFWIRDPEKTYSESRIQVQGSKRHRIPDPRSGSATLYCKRPVEDHGEICLLVHSLLECKWNHLKLLESIKLWFWRHLQ